MSDPITAIRTDIDTIDHVHDDGEEEEQELDEEEDYELQRLDNIRKRDALLSSLGLDKPAPAPAPAPAPVPRPTPDGPQVKAGDTPTRLKTRARTKEKEMKMAGEPRRRSRRVAEKAPIAMTTPTTTPTRLSTIHATPTLPRHTAPILPPAPEGPAYSPDTIDPVQAPRPTRRPDGRFDFQGRWAGVFLPNVSPEEMFSGGAFGGAFFRDVYSTVTRAELSSASALESLPFTLSDSGAAPAAADRLTQQTPDGSVNRFGVTAGQSLEAWEKAGWIWAGDPRGWAEWYVRFWEGRRCADDERQVRRWLKVAGPTGRFKRALLKKIQAAGGKAAVNEEDVGRVVKQCLWQWGYELTEEEYEDAMRV